MPLPNNGPIGIRDLVAEFGGTANPKLSDYYKGGNYVSNYALAPNVPTSGPLRLSNFYGASAIDTTWLTMPGVEFLAVPGTIQVPEGWRHGSAYGAISLDNALISAPPPAGITDTTNVHTLAIDIKMSTEFVYDPNKALHFVVGSRHPGREYLGAGDNKAGGVIGGAVFNYGYYGIEGIELGDTSGPNNNTFPWVWDGVLSPNVWWRVVIVTQYSAGVSSMKAMLFNETGVKLVDTSFYSIAPDAAVFSKASRDHHVVLAIIFGGPPTASFKFKNVRSYWSTDVTGIPVNP